MAAAAPATYNNDFLPTDIDFNYNKHNKYRKNLLKINKIKKNIAH